MRKPGCEHPVPSFTKHHAIGLARLVADLAEQWLEEEEARVTGFTVAGYARDPSSPHVVDIPAPGKEAFVKKDRRSAGCYSRQESKNRLRLDDRKGKKGKDRARDR